MFLQSDYNDLMPPEPEDGGATSEKTGFSRFMEIMGNQCTALLLTNILFLLCCIPVATIPLSLFALNRAVRQMVQGQPVKCLQVFGETFRRDWKRAYPAFLVTAAPLCCAGYGMWFYLGQAASSLLFLLPFLVCSTIFLTALLSSLCLYGLLEDGKSLRESMRLALLMGVAKPSRTVPAALCCFGLPLLAVLLFPFSGVYLFVIGFSLPCLIGNFLLRTLLNQRGNNTAF